MASRAVSETLPHALVRAIPTWSERVFQFLNEEIEVVHIEQGAFARHGSIH